MQILCCVTKKAPPLKGHHLQDVPSTLSGSPHGTQHCLSLFIVGSNLLETIDSEFPLPAGKVLPDFFRREGGGWGGGGVTKGSP